MKKHIQFIVPVYNEAEGLPELVRRIHVVWEAPELREIEGTLLFVNDGSQDDSQRVIEQLHAVDPRIGVLRLSRNFGHQSALSAGLDRADADAIVMMDADLQDPPELLPQMVALWRDQGAEVIYCVRQNRKEGFMKRACYAGFYRCFAFLTGLALPLDSGDFSFLNRQAYTALRDLPERVRFLRGLRHWIGFKQVALPYDRPQRFAGNSKYGFFSLYKLATDGLASFSVFPLRIAQFFSFVFGIMTMGILVALIFHQNLATKTYFELHTFIFCFSFSMLFLCLYILGAYVTRMYQEAKRRPLYIVADFIPPRRTGGRGTTEGA